MIRVNDRVRLKAPVENHGTCYIESGETGTVVEIQDDPKYESAIWVRLDTCHPELEEWDNQVQIWDGSMETTVDDLAAQYLEWAPCRAKRAQ